MSLNSSTTSAGDDILATQYNDIREDIVQFAGDYVATTGSLGAYLATLDAQVTAYVESATYIVKANHTNPGASTININGIGVKSLVKHGSVALQANDIRSGCILILKYDGTNVQVLSCTDNLYSAKGDLLVGTANGQKSPLTAGADGKQIIATAAEATGLKYITRTYLLDVDNTPVSFTNTTTETTLLSVSVPAGHLGTNGGLTGRINLSALNVNTGDSISFRLKLGATTIATITIGNPSGARTDLGYLEFEVFNLNSASSQYGLIRLFASDPSTSDQSTDLWWNQDGGTSSIDTASAATLAVTGQFNDTSLNNVCTSESYHIKILGEA